MEERYAAARHALHAASQGQVLAFWDRLSTEQREGLLTEIENVDFRRLNEIFRRTGRGRKASGAALVPPDNVVWDASGNRPQLRVCSTTRLSATPADTKRHWQRRGLEMIARGEVAVVLMAGGQGTRLGHDAPKGCFKASPVAKCSLFEVFCERLVKLKELAGAERHIPLYVMTSATNLEATRSFFEENARFGLPDDGVSLFVQNEVPCLDADGKVLMESGHQIAKNPNGNGGVFDALGSSGSLSDMKARGVKGLHIVGVDNLLTKVADPTLAGFVDESGAEIGNKCCERLDPDEAVGVMCIRLRDGMETATVVEYSEQSEEFKDREVATGQLKFCSANICNHYFTLAFVERLIENRLMDANYDCHAAAKRIPYFDIDTAATIAPVAPNGVKLELFIFDAFEHATSVVGLIGAREEEFSPIKNATGKDSPETASRMMSRLHWGWMKAAGASLKPPCCEEAVVCEVRPSASYEGENLEESCSGRQFESPILIESVKNV
eukprot:Polyplicarium_translucidae@DN1489_c0_g1_i1.p1